MSTQPRCASGVLIAHPAKGVAPPWTPAKTGLRQILMKGRFIMASHDDFSEEIVPDGEPSVIRKRQNQVKVYLSDAELARFRDLQKETSLSAAALLRRWITGQRIESTVDIQAINEMRRQGGLFKNSAWSLGSRGKIDKSEVAQLIDLAADIHAIARGMRDGYKENPED